MIPAPKPLMPIEILLVEDNPGDVDLVREYLESSRVVLNLTVVPDGVEAEAYLRQEGRYCEARRPDLIMLDLNLPRRSGGEVLASIKKDEALRAIPVVVLTSSGAEVDIARSYTDGANCYITKPVTLAGLQEVVNAVESFWFTIVRLPAPGGTPA